MLIPVPEDSEDLKRLMLAHTPAFRRLMAKSKKSKKLESG